MFSQVAKATVVTSDPSQLVLISMQTIDSIQRPRSVVSEDSVVSPVGTRLEAVQFIPTPIGEGEFAQVFPCLLNADSK